MITRVRRWGNSLALRLPAALASEARLKDGSEVDLAVRKGALVAVPIGRPPLRLRDLLARVTGGNLHRKVDFGRPVGRERL